MAAYEILLLNTAIPQIQAAQSGDTYVVPRDIAFSTVAYLANGTNLLPSLTFSSNTNTGIYREGADALGFTAGGGTNLMVLTTTGLGIGTNNPAQKLSVQGSSTTYALAETTGTGTSSGFRMKAGASADYTLFTTQGVNQFAIYDNVAASERLTLSSSGNLGLGVTPSAWASDWKVMQIGGRSAFAQYNVNASAVVANNVYFAGAGGSNPTYIDTAAASFYQQVNGQHNWYNAPSGTAGNAISFTQAMTLDANGDLGVGTTSIPSGGASTRNVSIHNSNSAATYFKLSNGATGNTASDGFDLVMGTSSDAYVFNRENGPMLFGTNSTERARITSGGEFQIGPSGGNGTGTISASPAGTGFTNQPGSDLVLQSGNSTGTGASIIKFLTPSAGSSGTSTNTATERARITSGGYFKASNTGNYNNVAGTYHELRSDANASTARITNIISSGYTDAQLQITFPAYTPNTTAAWFVYCDDSTNQKAGILTTGTFESRTSTYGGVSDAKLKQDIADAASQWDDLKAVRVRKFRFKDEPDSALQIGVVAQELESVSPGLIYETPDYKEVEIIDDEGNTKKERQLTGTTTKSVKYSILYMKAVKALQEAMARIEKLEAEVAALKGA